MDKASGWESKVQLPIMGALQHIVNLSMHHLSSSSKISDFGAIYGYMEKKLNSLKCSTCQLD